MEGPNHEIAAPVLLALVFARAFFYFTTYRSGQMHPANWFGRPSNRVEITEASVERRLRR